MLCLKAGGLRGLTRSDGHGLGKARPLVVYFPMAIDRIQVLSIPVSDQEVAKAFYVDVLGFDLVRDNPMGPGQRWVEVAPRGAATSMTLVTWFETMPPGSLRGLVLETEDLEGTIDEIAERGHRIVGEIHDAPWGRYVTLEDPDGNGLILQSTLA